MTKKQSKWNKMHQVRRVDRRCPSMDEYLAWGEEASDAEFKTHVSTAAEALYQLAAEHKYGRTPSGFMSPSRKYIKERRDPSVLVRAMQHWKFSRVEPYLEEWVKVLYPHLAADVILSMDREVRDRIGDELIQIVETIPPTAYIAGLCEDEEWISRYGVRLAEAVCVSTDQQYVRNWADGCGGRLKVTEMPDEVATAAFVTWPESLYAAHSETLSKAAARNPRAAHCTISRLANGRRVDFLTRLDSDWDNEWIPVTAGKVYLERLENPSESVYALIHDPKALRDMEQHPEIFGAVLKAHEDVCRYEMFIRGVGK